MVVITRWLLADSGRRRLLQTQPSTTTRPLAVKGDRRDPLNSFHKYRGGYDVKNKHYWAVCHFSLMCEDVMLNKAT